MELRYWCRKIKTSKFYLVARVGYVACEYIQRREIVTNALLRTNKIFLTRTFTTRSRGFAEIDHTMGIVQGDTVVLSKGPKPLKVDDFAQVVIQLRPSIVKERKFKLHEGDLNEQLKKKKIMIMDLNRTIRRISKQRTAY